MRLRRSRRRTINRLVSSRHGGFTRTRCSGPKLQPATLECNPSVALSPGGAKFQSCTSPDILTCSHTIRAYVVAVGSYLREGCLSSTCATTTSIKDARIGSFIDFALLRAPIKLLSADPTPLRGKLDDRSSRAYRRDQQSRPRHRSSRPVGYHRWFHASRLEPTNCGVAWMNAFDTNGAIRSRPLPDLRVAYLRSSLPRAAECDNRLTLSKNGELSRLPAKTSNLGGARSERPSNGNGSNSDPHRSLYSFSSTSHRLSRRPAGYYERTGEHEER